MSDGLPPLAGVRVVERATGLAGTYAGFLLAGLGAEVMRVGAARAAPGERVLDRGKRSVSDVTGRLVGADVVLSDESVPDVPAADGLVRCRVTTWGDSGDRRSLPRDEALVAAATAVQAMQWSWSRRPVWLVTPMLSYMSGMLAALGTTAALFARRRGASGQAVRVDALHAALALNSGTYVGGRETRGSLSQFGDPRGQFPTYSLYRTADGWIFIGALTQAFVVKLLTVVDRLELLADPRLPPHPFAWGAPDIKDFVRGELDPVLARRTSAEWLRLLRAGDVPCGPVRTRDEALADPEARALGLVVPVDDPLVGPSWQPGAIAEFSETPAPVSAPAEVTTVRAPRHTSTHAPRACLEGVRVLDLSSYIAGPFCPLLLADLGAEVVKIESAEGDPFRMAAFGFIGWNRGKRSLVLDLKRPEGRDVFLDLVRQADVVVENFRAGVMERLGLGWDTLHATNERVIHTSITGYGTTGELSMLPGFDPLFQARSGLMAAQGGAGDPIFHLIAYNDYAAGTLGALATTAALLAREHTGRGQRVDVSLFRTSYVAQAAHMIACAGRPPDERGGRDHVGPSACRRLYACQDGWICIAAESSAQAAALGRLAGRDVTRGTPAEGREAEALANVLSELSRDAAIACLTAAGVPALACLTFGEVLADAHLRARRYMIELDHPALGPVVQPGAFIDFEATPVTLRRSAPLLGADAIEVLGEIGYDADRVARLIAGGVVGKPG